MAEETKEKDTEERSEPKAGGEQDESKSDNKTCPECNEPIDNVRKTCANCGYEYKDSDYDDTDAGNEFMAGSNIDDEGNEITDEGPGVEEGAE